MARRAHLSDVLPYRAVGRRERERQRVPGEAARAQRGREQDRELVTRGAPPASDGRKYTVIVSQIESAVFCRGKTKTHKNADYEQHCAPGG